MLSVIVSCGVGIAMVRFNTILYCFGLQNAGIMSTADYAVESQEGNGK